MKKLFAKLAALGPIVNQTFDGAILVVTCGALGFMRVIDPAGRAHFRLGVFSRKEAAAIHARIVSEWCSNKTSKNLLLQWEQLAAEIAELKATREITADCLAKCKKSILDVIEAEFAYRTFLEKRVFERGLRAA